MSAPERDPEPAGTPCGSVLHVLVVGFHHKRGCQVDFSYPPLIPGQKADSADLPDKWRHLPALALPDGAHNTTEDTIFFHLPSLDDSKKTVFGISCYRQMDAQELLHRENDITRNTVQKSVCVLSTIPLYGLIKAKLELITHAYFKERDFSKVTLLEETYRNLNASLNAGQLQGTQVFLGLSGRDIVQKFKHKILVLFKLILLERRVLFFTAPVEPICSTMLTILSLFPGMLERGLVECADTTPQESHDEADYALSSPDEPWSHDASSPDSLPPAATDHDGLHRSTLDTHAHADNQQGVTNHHTDAQPDDADQCNTLPTHSSPPPAQVEVTQAQSAQGHDSLGKDTTDINTAEDSNNTKHLDLSTRSSLGEDQSHTKSSPRLEDLLESEDSVLFSDDKVQLKIDGLLTFDCQDSSLDELKSPSSSSTSRVTNLLPGEQSLSKDSLQLSSSSSTNSLSGKPSKPSRRKKSRKAKNQIEPEYEDVSEPLTPSQIEADAHGMPLSVFTKGNVCHPYLCLQYFDLLSDDSIRGFLIGATNQLFKRKKHLVDVVVEIAECRLDLTNADLKRQLTLSTADLRFADFLVRNVSDDQGDIFLDDTEWEGGDEWLRSQFRMYLFSLLATVTCSDDKLLADDFNPQFVSAWKKTYNYRVFRSSLPESIQSVEPGHPFHGHLSMADMRLKLSQMFKRF